MTEQQACDYILHRPNYESRTDISYNSETFNLSYMRHLLKLYKNPDYGIKIIHVAGTNGKGSTCFFTEQALISAGRSVATFTSPHVEHLRERFRLNGSAVPASCFCSTVEQLIPLQSKEHPTTFELCLLIMMLLCRNNKIEYCVVETGLGGRLDSTNALLPVCAALSPIAMDHQHILGNTIAAIAREKAGIIKEAVPVLSCSQHPEAMQQIMEQAVRVRAPLSELITRGSESKAINQCSLQANDGESYLLSRGGDASAKALQMALAILGILRISWDPAALQKRLDEQSGLPARQEFFPGAPPVLLDGAHNPHALEALRNLITRHWKGRVISVLAFMADKDYATAVGICESYSDIIFFTECGTDRDAQAELLAAECRSIPCTICTDAVDAFLQACHAAEESDLVCVAGSFYLAGIIRPLLSKNPAEM